MNDSDRSLIPPGILICPGAEEKELPGRQRRTSPEESMGGRKHHCRLRTRSLPIRTTRLRAGARGTHENYDLLILRARESQPRNPGANARYGMPGFVNMFAVCTRAKAAVRAEGWQTHRRSPRYGSTPWSLYFELALSELCRSSIRVSDDGGTPSLSPGQW